eukprot:Sspe_Gene.26049::Locus_10643_Transcript_1_1_Confidence_1.000_Length_11164::g.26049::m.26049
MFNMFDILEEGSDEQKLQKLKEVLEAEQQEEVAQLKQRLRTCEERRRRQVEESAQRVLYCETRMQEAQDAAEAAVKHAEAREQAAVKMHEEARQKAENDSTLLLAEVSRQQTKVAEKQRELQKAMETITAAQTERDALRQDILRLESELKESKNRMRMLRSEVSDMSHIKDTRDRATSPIPTLVTPPQPEGTSQSSPLKRSVTPLPRSPKQKEMQQMYEKVSQMEAKLAEADAQLAGKERMYQEAMRRLAVMQAHDEEMESARMRKAVPARPAEAPPAPTHPRSPAPPPSKNAPASPPLSSQLPPATAATTATTATSPMGYEIEDPVPPPPVQEDPQEVVACREGAELVQRHTVDADEELPPENSIMGVLVVSIENVGDPKSSVLRLFNEALQPPLCGWLLSDYPAERQFTIVFRDGAIGLYRGITSMVAVLKEMSRVDRPSFRIGGSAGQVTCCVRMDGTKPVVEYKGVAVVEATKLHYCSTERQIVLSYETVVLVRSMITMPTSGLSFDEFYVPPTPADSATNSPTNSGRPTVPSSLVSEAFLMVVSNISVGRSEGDVGAKDWEAGLGLNVPPLVSPEAAVVWVLPPDAPLLAETSFGGTQEAIHRGHTMLRFTLAGTPYPRKLEIFCDLHSTGAYVAAFTGVSALAHAIAFAVRASQAVHTLPIPTTLTAASALPAVRRALNVGIEDHVLSPGDIKGLRWAVAISAGPLMFHSIGVKPLGAPYPNSFYGRRASDYMNHLWESRSQYWYGPAVRRGWEAVRQTAGGEVSLDPDVLSSPALASALPEAQSLLSNTGEGLLRLKGVKGRRFLRLVCPSLSHRIPYLHPVDPDAPISFSEEMTAYSTVPLPPLSRVARFATLPWGSLCEGPLPPSPSRVLGTQRQPLAAVTFSAAADAAVLPELAAPLCQAAIELFWQVVFTTASGYDGWVEVLEGGWSSFEGCVVFGSAAEAVRWAVKASEALLQVAWPSVVIAACGNRESEEAEAEGVTGGRKTTHGPLTTMCVTTLSHLEYRVEGVYVRTDPRALEPAWNITRDVARNGQLLVAQAAWEEATAILAADGVESPGSTALLPHESRMFATWAGLLPLPTSQGQWRPVPLGSGYLRLTPPYHLQTPSSSLPLRNHLPPVSTEEMVTKPRFRTVFWQLLEVREDQHRRHPVAAIQCARMFDFAWHLAMCRENGVVEAFSLEHPSCGVVLSFPSPANAILYAAKLNELLELAPWPSHLLPTWQGAVHTVPRLHVVYGAFESLEVGGNMLQAGQHGWVVLSPDVLRCVEDEGLLLPTAFTREDGVDQPLAFSPPAESTQCAEHAVPPRHTHVALTRMRLGLAKSRDGGAGSSAIPSYEKGSWWRRHFTAPLVPPIGGTTFIVAEMGDWTDDIARLMRSCADRVGCYLFQSHVAGDDKRGWGLLVHTVLDLVLFILHARSVGTQGLDVQSWRIGAARVGPQDALEIVSGDDHIELAGWGIQRARSFMGLLSTGRRCRLVLEKQFLGARFTEDLVARVGSFNTRHPSHPIAKADLSRVEIDEVAQPPLSLAIICFPPLNELVASPTLYPRAKERLSSAPPVEYERRSPPPHGTAALLCLTFPAAAWEAMSMALRGQQQRHVAFDVFSTVRYYLMRCIAAFGRGCCVVHWGGADVNEIVVAAPTVVEAVSVALSVQASCKGLMWGEVPIELTAGVYLATHVSYQQSHTGALSYFGCGVGAAKRLASLGRKRVVVMNPAAAQALQLPESTDLVPLTWGALHPKALCLATVSRSMTVTCDEPWYNDPVAYGANEKHVWYLVVEDRKNDEMSAIIRLNTGESSPPKYPPPLPYQLEPSSITAGCEMDEVFFSREKVWLVVAVFYSRSAEGLRRFAQIFGTLLRVHRGGESWVHSEDPLSVAVGVFDGGMDCPSRAMTVAMELFGASVGVAVGAGSVAAEWDPRWKRFRVYGAPIAALMRVAIWGRAKGKAFLCCEDPAVAYLASSLRWVVSSALDNIRFTHEAIEGWTIMEFGGLEDIPDQLGRRYSGVMDRTLSGDASRVLSFSGRFSKMLREPSLTVLQLEGTVDLVNNLSAIFSGASPSSTEFRSEAVGEALTACVLHSESTMFPPPSPPHDHKIALVFTEFPGLRAGSIAWSGVMRSCCHFLHEAGGFASLYSPSAVVHVFSGNDGALLGVGALLKTISLMKEMLRGLPLPRAAVASEMPSRCVVNPRSGTSLIVGPLSTHLASLASAARPGQIACSPLWLDSSPLNLHALGVPTEMTSSHGLPVATYESARDVAHVRCATIAEGEPAHSLPSEAPQWASSGLGSHLPVPSAVPHACIAALFIPGLIDRPASLQDVVVACGRVCADSIRRLCSYHQGIELLTSTGTGFGWFLVFRTPTDAIQFSLALQHTLLHIPWPDRVGALWEEEGAASHVVYRGARVAVAVHHAGKEGKTLLQATVSPALVGNLFEKAWSLLDFAPPGQIVCTPAVFERSKDCTFTSEAALQGNHLLVPPSLIGRLKQGASSIMIPASKHAGWWRSALPYLTSMRNEDEATLSAGRRLMSINLTEHMQDTKGDDVFLVAIDVPEYQFPVDLPEDMACGMYEVYAEAIAIGTVLFEGTTMTLRNIETPRTPFLRLVIFSDAVSAVRFVIWLQLKLLYVAYPRRLIALDAGQAITEGGRPGLEDEREGPSGWVAPWVGSRLLWRGIKCTIGVHCGKVEARGGVMEGNEVAAKVLRVLESCTPGVALASDVARDSYVSMARPEERVLVPPEGEVIPMGTLPCVPLGSDARFGDFKLRPSKTEHSFVPILAATPEGLYTITPTVLEDRATFPQATASKVLRPPSPFSNLPASVATAHLNPAPVPHHVCYAFAYRMIEMARFTAGCITGLADQKPNDVAAQFLQEILGRPPDATDVEKAIREAIQDNPGTVQKSNSFEADSATSALAKHLTVAFLAAFHRRSEANQQPLRRPSGDLRTARKSRLSHSASARVLPRRSDSSAPSKKATPSPRTDPLPSQPAPPVAEQPATSPTVQPTPPTPPTVSRRSSFATGNRPTRRPSIIDINSPASPVLSPTHSDGISIKKTFSQVFEDDYTVQTVTSVFHSPLDPIEGMALSISSPSRPRPKPTTVTSPISSAAPSPVTTLVPPPKHPAAPLLSPPNHHPAPPAAPPVEGVVEGITPTPPPAPPELVGEGRPDPGKAVAPVAVKSPTPPASLLATAAPVKLTALQVLSGDIPTQQPADQPPSALPVREEVCTEEASAASPRSPAERQHPENPTTQQHPDNPTTLLAKTMAANSFHAPDPHPAIYDPPPPGRMPVVTNLLPTTRLLSAPRTTPPRGEQQGTPRGAGGREGLRVKEISVADASEWALEPGASLTSQSRSQRGEGLHSLEGTTSSAPAGEGVLGRPWSDIEASDLHWVSREDRPLLQRPLTAVTTEHAYATMFTKMKGGELRPEIKPQFPAIDQRRSPPRPPFPRGVTSAPPTSIRSRHPKTARSRDESREPVPPPPPGGIPGTAKAFREYVESVKQKKGQAA